MSLKQKRHERTRLGVTSGSALRDHILLLLEVTPPGPRARMVCKSAKVMPAAPGANHLHAGHLLVAAHTFTEALWRMAMCSEPCA